METKSGDKTPPVIKRLLKKTEAPRFSFFQAVRLLEAAHSEAAGIGGDGKARDEIVRLRPDTSLAKPRTLVKSVEKVADPIDGKERYRITQNLMGLYGIRSPLPTVYSLEIARRGREDDPVRDFLDLFNHRLLSLRYRAWARSRPEVLYRRHGTDDPITALVFCAIGFPPDFLEHMHDWDRRGLTRYAAFFGRTTRTAEGLEKMLSDLLGGARVRVKPYALQYVPVPADQQCRLGRSSSRFGKDFVAGSTIPDRSGKFRIRIGPLKYSDYIRLAPEGAWRAAAATLIDLYLVDALDYEVELYIPAEEKKEKGMRFDAEDGGARLGVDSWFCTGSPEGSWERFQGFEMAGKAAGREEVS